MADSIEQLVRRWSDESLNEVNQRLGTLEKRLYCAYEPSLPPNPCFWRRLESWLGNLQDSEDDAKKALLKLAADIFFVGPAEFLELYRVAYEGPIARWLIDEEGINLLDHDAQQKLRHAVAETWFCPITDSMRINSFYNSNNVPTKADYRPDWRSLDRFGDAEKIIAYCKKKGFKRLVLLEDFVGGGSQMQKAVEYAATINNGPNVLVVPLIVCPAGLDSGMKIKAMHPGKVSFEPIICLPPEVFVSQTASQSESEFFRTLRELAIASYGKMTGGHAPAKYTPPYHPLGFSFDAPTGGLVVMYTNTPNNTLPLIHWSSSTWSPLFPRNNRV